MRLKKGDTIQVNAGKDRGKTGKILRVLHKHDTVIVEGINMFKKHVRPRQQGQKGEIVNISRPLNAAKVMVYCSSCARGVRVGFRIDEGGKNKVRYCKKCQRPI
jgi:large subunit ribosomal protein L24